VRELMVWRITSEAKPNGKSDARFARPTVGEATRRSDSKPGTARQNRRPRMRFGRPVMGRRFGIEFSPSSRRELGDLRIFDHRKVLEAIERKLTYDPNVQTKDKKILGWEPANFGYVPPLWELRAREFRAFYDVDEAEGIVCIRAVRRKPPHKTTSEVLNEANGD